MATIKFTDFPKICRTCLLQKDKMESVFKLDVPKMLSTFANIQIAIDDTLPALVCLDCLQQILNCYKFKQQCENNDRVLHRVRLQITDKLFQAIPNIEHEINIKTEDSLNESLEQDNTDDSNDYAKDSVRPNNASNVIELKKENKLQTKKVKNERRIYDSNESLEQGNTGGSNDAGEFQKPNNVNKLKKEKEFQVKKERRIYDSNETEHGNTGGSNDYSVGEFEKHNNVNNVIELKKQNDLQTKKVIKERRIYDNLDSSEKRNCVCKICGKVLVTIHTLARHMQIHNKDREFTHRCEVCQKGFYEKGHLNKHMRRHEGVKRYSCEVCNKGFYELSAQAVHMKKHNAKPVSCTVCNKEFMVKLQLDIHIKTHSNEPSNVCSYCGKRFAQPNKLERHKLSHQSIRAYSCELCDSKFKYSFTLKQHHETVHRGVKRKKDVCNICGKSVSYLKSHMLGKHSNQRPYNCEECGAGFVSNALLNVHIRSKHKGELVFTALCSVCGKQCQSSTVLEIHMRSHTKERPFECSTCNKGFMSAGALKVHVRSHTGERPYVCNTCGKAFSTSQLLKVHNRIHTGERPYRCGVCERTFRQRCALRTHLKLH